MAIGTIAAIGSIIASLVALPAGGGFGITGDLAAATSDLPRMQEESRHKQLSEHTTSDSMKKTLETPYGKASFSSEPGRFEMKLESALYDVNSVRTSEKTVRRFEGPGTELEIVTSPDGTEETCSTPQGSIEVTREEGTVDRQVSGVSVSEVRAECRDARNKLEEGIQKLARISADIGMVSKEIEISSVNETEESVTVSNTGPVPVRMSNWSI
ncbi:MAG: hypothetical protein ABEJ62_00340, partial [Candidatus Nanohaloarchaea archaeon]